jgi:hypothetical protein
MIQKARQYVRLTIPYRPETFPAPAREMAEGIKSVYLVGKRPPLKNYPVLWRFLARFVYHRLNWCPDYGIEYQGVFTDEAEARHAASGPGMFYMELPLNAELPEETSQFGVHDFPLSEASSEYRNRRFSFVTIPRRDFELLDDKTKEFGRRGQRSASA